VKRFGIFGSYARREQTPSSDIDILLDYEELPNMLELIELEYYLEEIPFFLKWCMYDRESNSFYRAFFAGAGAGVAETDFISATRKPVN